MKFTKTAFQLDDKIFSGMKELWAIRRGSFFLSYALFVLLFNWLRKGSWLSISL